jgi:hypothetical protein
MSPTGRSLDLLRRQKYLPWIVERWIPGASIRKDFLGFVDLLALKVGEPILAVQTTSAANVAARLTKAQGLASLRTWLACGGAFVVHGWAKSGKDGLWHVRIVQVSPEDLIGVEVQSLPPSPAVAEGGAATRVVRRVEV